MSLKVDRLQLEIIINNDQARKSLRALDDEARSIQKSMKGMTEGTDEWIQSTKRLSSIKTQMDGIQDSIGITGMSLKELSAKQREFNMLVSNLPANSPEYAKYKQTLDEINGRIKELKGNAKDVNGALEGQGGGMSQIFEKVKGAAIGLGVAAAAAFSLDAIKEYVKGGIEAAIKLRDTEGLLLEELNGQKSVQTDLIELAKKRAGSTMYSRLEIEDAEKFLAIQQRTPEQIKKTIDAATNLAALTGVSLKEAVETLDATMEGKLGKGLGKLEKDFKGLTKEQMYNGAAIDIVAQKYGGLAEREMNTVEGRVNLLGKAWNGLQRTLGETVLDSGGMFAGIIDGATSLLNTFKKLIEVPVSQKIQQEKDDLNSLVFQIQATNTNQSERNRLLDELRTKYPEFLGNLTNEEATNKRLATTLANVNEQYVAKIRLASSEDQLKKIAEVQQKASDKLTKAEHDRNSILAKQMDLLYQANSTAAKLVENAPSLDEKIELVKKYFGGTGGTGEAFLKAAQKAKEASKTMTDATKEFTDAQLKIAEDGVNGALNLSKSLDGVSNEILNMALKTKDADLKAVIQTELADRESQIRLAAKHKEDAKLKIDLTKATEEELQKIISEGAVQGATEADKTMGSAAKKELNRREGLSKAYEKYMDLMREIADIEKTNFAEKLSQTEGEIKSVNDKYNNEIKKIEEFKEHNKKDLSPAKTKELDNKVGELEITRDAQTKQVLEQAEKDFADKVALIHENLRVARMSITGREIYEINKKYDESQKEILDAVEYRYKQEISQANGNKEKILLAEKNKADALEQIQGDLSKLEIARKEETDKANKAGEITYEQDLKALKIKSETDLATGKEKIQMEINKKYKKLLDENVGDEKRTNEIKAQMEDEFNAASAAAGEEEWKKKFDKIKEYAQFAINQLSGLASAWSDYQNGLLQRDEVNTTKQKDTLKKQLDAKLISQKQYDEGVSKLDAEADKKKRKIAHDQAIVQKATSVANAIINTAVAITSVLSIPILGEALAIVVGLLGAAQIALILATPIPQAATGRYNVIGNQDGKAYNNVPYQNSFNGIPGRPMLVNETGNEIVIDPYTTRNLQMNYPDIIEGINQARVPQRAGGSYPYATSQRTVGGISSQSVFDSEALQVIKDFTSQLKKPLDATIVYDNMKYSMNTVAQLEKSVTR